MKMEFSLGGYRRAKILKMCSSRCDTVGSQVKVACSP